MCKWSVNVESLLRNATLLVNRSRRDRAHVVHAVGQFDDEHAHVLGHCHQHFAHRGCLLSLTRIELQSLELGKTINNARNLCTKTCLNIGKRNFRVFNGIVQ